MKSAPQPTMLPGPIATLPPAGCSACAAKADKQGQARTGLRQWLVNHRHEPDGCPLPSGCGNAYTDFKFAFGSCRQFFGTGDAAQGCWNKTELPSPPYR
jgi:hypothetical protein